VVKLAIAFAFAGACARPTPTAPRRDEIVGHPAPRFALPVVGGADSLALASLTGHVVIVDFWASWCTPCEAAVPHLDAWQQRYPSLRIVGVSGDDDGDIARYASTREIAYPLVRDDGDAVATEYQVAALPTLVVIDRIGVVRYVDVGGRNFGAIETIVAKLVGER
jgi:cytochrome c biogenesis protein CcmG, thiol:disulfide interchange protein DsbE